MIYIIIRRPIFANQSPVFNPNYDLPPLSSVTLREPPDVIPVFPGGGNLTGKHGRRALLAETHEIR